MWSENIRNQEISTYKLFTFIKQLLSYNDEKDNIQ